MQIMRQKQQTESNTMSFRVGRRFWYMCSVQCAECAPNLESSRSTLKFQIISSAMIMVIWIISSEIIKTYSIKENHMH